jgi:hypothetical protein
LLVPRDIAECLTPRQLEAVLAHELCHIRRRDNLVAAVHMVVEALFWFHPLVWWIGARLVDERERACDEHVLSVFGEPRTYAEGIVNICRQYVEAPLACVSGVSGAHLKQRVEEIMTNRIVEKLNVGRKVLLAGVGIVAVAGPIAVGIGARQVRAQSLERPPVGVAPAFEVASIKPSDVGGNYVEITPGTVSVHSATLRTCITWGIFSAAQPGSGRECDDFKDARFRALRHRREICESGSRKPAQANAPAVADGPLHDDAASRSS